MTSGLPIGAPGEGRPSLPPPAVVGESDELQHVLSMVEACAKRDMPVLLSGESGTGKELFARRVHRLSGRTGPFMAINCGGITATLIESELFGHERGAFTGASETKRGLFEVASGGTLFLDEIGEMELGLQVTLLRVLQEREIRRVGGREAIRVDARVIAATNADLADLVRRGRFREDLYYRLNVFHIALPALRERRGDIVPLARYFATAIATRSGTRPPELTPDAERVLESWDWPGNVRELQSVMERAMALRPAGRLEASDFPLVRQRPEDFLKQAARAGKSLADVERAYILAVLQSNGYRRAQTARQLGISTNTLWRKLKEYGVRDTPPEGERPPGSPANGHPQAW